MLRGSFKLLDDKLLFVFGLPRSGTTVLQRLLASSDNAKTYDETWLLQRLISTDKNPFSSPSNYRTAMNASFRSCSDIEDRLFQLVCKILLDSRDSADQVVVEKTPRNYLYLEQFHKYGARSVGIVRRPSDILNSFYREFLFGSFRGLIDYQIDIVVGTEMVARESYNNKSLILKYEEIGNSSSLELLSSFVGLPLDPNGLRKLPGNIGDTNGEKKLKVRIRKELTGIDTYVKKVVTKYILRKYFRSYCNVFGYPLSQELQRVDSTSHASFSILRNSRDIFWLLVFAIQLTLYRLYRKVRNTCNLSKNLPCS